MDLLLQILKRQVKQVEIDIIFGNRKIYVQNEWVFTLYLTIKTVLPKGYETLTPFKEIIAFFRYHAEHTQGGARNVIPLIVHITHFYYNKSI